MEESLSKKEYLRRRLLSVVADVENSGLFSFECILFVDLVANHILSDLKDPDSSHDWEEEIVGLENIVINTKQKKGK